MYSMMIDNGTVTSKFDIATFWKNQSVVVLYHGTSASKLDSIMVNGLVPSKGLTFLTTSVSQADAYARMGGEEDYLNNHTDLLPEDMRTVLEITIEPENLNLNGSPNFQTEDAYNKVQAQIIEFFADDKDAMMLEFTTSTVIRPENIRRIR